MINGIVNVKKETGYTSFDVVAKLRKIFHIKKIGHTGTLDPNASGVLPVCIGSATKLVDMLTDKDKTYEVTMLLGTTTDSGDITGTVIDKKDVNVSDEALLEAIHFFTGEYDQVPPMYSAIKINGKKMYQLARAGVMVERKSRRVRIDSIKVLDISLPEVSLEVCCGKGTYIRSLCEDIGNRLFTGACVKDLRRTKVGPFLIKNSLTIDEIALFYEKGELDKFIVKPDDMFPDFGKIVVKSTSDRLLSNGNKLKEMDLYSKVEGKEKDYKVYFSDDTFAGIYALSDEEYKPVKMFLSE